MILKESTFSEIKNNSNKIVKENFTDKIDNGLDSIKENTIGKIYNDIGNAINNKAVTDIKNKISNTLNSPLANDILRIAGDINSMSGKTADDISCNNLRKQIARNDEIIAYDGEIINELLIERANLDGDKASKAIIVSVIQDTLRQTRDGMRKECYDIFLKFLEMFGDTTSGLDPMVVASMAIEKLMSLIQPFLELPNMPQIPFVGSLSDILKKLAKMGEISWELQKNEDQETAKEEQEEQEDKDNYWPIVSLIGEIFTAIYELIKTTPLILEIFIVLLLLELLETFKPVIDYFGLTYGPMVKLLFTVPEIFSILGGLYTAGSSVLEDIFINRLKPLFNMAYGIIDPGDDTIDEKLRYLLTEQKECELDNEGLNLKLNAKEFEMEIKDIEKSKKDIDREISKLNGEYFKATNLEKGEGARSSLIGSSMYFTKKYAVEGLPVLLASKVVNLLDSLNDSDKKEAIASLEETKKSQDNSITVLKNRLEITKEKLKDYDEKYNKEKTEVIPKDVEEYLNGDEISKRQDELKGTNTSSQASMTYNSIREALGGDIYGQ